MSYRVVNEVDAAGADSDYRIDNPKKEGGSVSTSARGGVAERRDGAMSASNEAKNGKSRKMDEDEEREAVFYRLEMLGYRVGQGLVERFVLIYEAGVMHSGC